jgi:hypothetical protein
MEEVFSDRAKTIFRSAQMDSFYVCEPLLHWEIQSDRDCLFSGIIQGFQIGKNDSFNRFTLKTKLYFYIAVLLLATSKN